MLWDIFCQVIDNHGDIGVCWRLASNLAARGETVRLWTDDASALAWMAPHGAPGVQVGEWRADSVFPPAGDVVVEAFGCEPPVAFVHAMGLQAHPPCWINLEYLTAQGFAERSHGLASPMSGPGAGLARRFFYPGFSSGTGGLLREADLFERQSRFDRDAWLRGIGIDLGTDPDIAAAGALTISLFCYEPRALPALLQQLDRSRQPTRLLVTAGRAAAAVRAHLQTSHAMRAGTDPAPPSSLSVHYLPQLTQRDYDHLLWASDFNFVRGEDSLVRALWSGRPFCWQIYPQDDGAHHAKLAAFLELVRAPPSWRRFHEGWNGLTTELPPLDPSAWRACIQKAREHLLAQDDLATQLLRFVRAKGAVP